MSVAPRADPADADAPQDYKLSFSIGASIRQTHRAFAQELQQRLSPSDIAPGMWYFLRVLWEEDGLTQRELSQRVGSMEPTTVEQLRNMEKRGLISRIRAAADRRKIQVFLTPAGRALKRDLAPIAAEVNAAALEGLSEGEVGFLRLVLLRIQDNLAGIDHVRSEEGGRAKPTRPVK